MIKKYQMRSSLPFFCHNVVRQTSVVQNVLCILNEYQSATESQVRHEKSGASYKVKVFIEQGVATHSYRVLRM